MERTPRLDIQGDERLGNSLGLGLLLLAVLGQALLPDAGGLGILIFLVAAEQVFVIVVAAGLGSRPVSRVRLRGVTG